mgnify:CR=1 FL=1
MMDERGPIRMREEIRWTCGLQHSDGKMRHWGKAEIQGYGFVNGTYAPRFGPAPRCEEHEEWARVEVWLVQEPEADGGR